MASPNLESTRCIGFVRRQHRVDHEPEIKTLAQIKTQYLNTWSNSQLSEKVINEQVLEHIRKKRTLINKILSKKPIGLDIF